jgi:GNAT superfamily N-acetyltransferase
MAPTTDAMILATGTRVVVRPIRPSDAPRLTALHERLSVTTVYRRYFRVLPELSSLAAARRTTLDELWRFALVAIDPQGDVVAVARYEGAAGDSTAEIALVVDDALQRGGLGSELLVRLCDVAHIRGLTTLRADLPGTNTGMLRLLRRLSVPTSFTRDSDVVTAMVSVDTALTDPARVARALAHSGVVVDRDPVRSPQQPRRAGPAPDNCGARAEERARHHTPLSCTHGRTPCPPARHPSR